MSEISLARQEERVARSLARSFARQRVVVVVVVPVASGWPAGRDKRVRFRLTFSFR